MIDREAQIARCTELARKVWAPNAEVRFVRYSEGGPELSYVYVIATRQWVEAGTGAPIESKKCFARFEGERPLDALEAALYVSLRELPPWANDVLEEMKTYCSDGACTNMDRYWLKRLADAARGER